MFEWNNRKTIVLILIVVLFLAGLALGYYIWGAKKNKPVDYKQVLQETITYISTMEKKNEELSGRVTSLEAELSTITQKGQEAAGSNAGTISALNQRVQALEMENRRLNAAIGNIEAFALRDPALKQKIDALIQEANTGTAPGGSSQQGVPSPGQGATQAR